MARRFALQPELVARAAIEGGVSGFHGLAPGFFVHEAEHQHAAGCVILDHRWNETVEFLEIEFHMCFPKEKARRWCGRLFESCLLSVRSAGSPPRDGMPMMVVMEMLCGEADHEFVD